jgi:hypothetical protein
MNQCPKCNYPVQDSDSICSNCGYILNPKSDAASSYMYPPSPMNSQIRTNGYSIASMVLGIVSIPLVCCCYIGAIPAILAVIFGFIARNQIRESSYPQKGNGMALAGIITGFCSIGLILILLTVSFSQGFSNKDFWDGFRNGFSDGFSDGSNMFQ